MNNDEIQKTEAAINNPGLPPFLSAILPAAIQPTIAPNAKLPVAKPSQYSLRLNFTFKKGNAPDITAKSNPNKYPPSAEIKDKARIYFELYRWLLFVIMIFCRDKTAFIPQQKNRVCFENDG